MFVFGAVSDKRICPIQRAAFRSPFISVRPKLFSSVLFISFLINFVIDTNVKTATKKILLRIISVLINNVKT